MLDGIETNKLHISESLQIAGYTICRVSGETLFDLRDRAGLMELQLVHIRWGAVSPFINTDSFENDYQTNGFQCFNIHNAIAPPDFGKDPGSLCYGTFRAYGCRAGVLLYENKAGGSGFRFFHISDEFEFRPPGKAPQGFRFIGGVYGGGTQLEPRGYIGEYEAEKYDHVMRLGYAYPTHDSYSYFGLLIFPQWKVIYCGYDNSEIESYFEYMEKHPVED